MIAGPFRAFGQGAAGDNPVVAAARARQEKVKTLEIEFKRTEVVAPGAVSAMFDMLKPKMAIPQQETTIESVNRLVFDCDKIRYEKNEPTFVLQTGKLRANRAISLFNGSVGKIFRKDALDRDGNPQGLLLEKGELEKEGLWNVDQAEMAPIHLTFRGLEPILLRQLQVTALKPSGVTLPIDGAKCEKYVFAFPTGNENHYWVEASKDYVIQRIQAWSKKKLTIQIDIRYRPHRACGWVPDSWVQKLYLRDGSLHSTTTFQVTAIRINEPQPAEQFDLLFPLGTHVHVRSTQKNYRVQPDGTMREVRVVNGEEVFGDEVIPQVEVPWYRHWRAWLIGAGAAPLVLVSAYFWRKKWKTAERHRSQVHQPGINPE